MTQHYEELKQQVKAVAAMANDREILDSEIPITLIVQRKLKEARSIKEKNDITNIYGQASWEEILSVARKRQSLNVGASVTKGRGDQEVVKLLLKESNFVSKIWSSLPLVQFVNGEHCMDLWHQKPKVPNIIDVDKAFGYMTKNCMNNIVWDEFIFYFVDLLTRAETELSKHWVVFQTGKLLRLNNAVGKTDIPDEHLLLAIDFHQSAKSSITHETLVFDRRDPYGSLQQMKDELYLTGTAILSMFSYMAQCDERTVEVRNANPRAPAGSKTAKKKPWLRDDLPHIIMINPHSATKYGCNPRSETSTDRKSPRPHQRRGHIRRLQPLDGEIEQRYVHVRPAWIGPTDWNFEGQTYRLINERKTNG